MPRRLSPLTDAQLARIVELDGDGAPIPAIARAVAAPYFTVFKAVKRLRATGWVCPLHALRCAVCGRAFLAGKLRDLCGRDECRRARIRRWGRETTKRRPGRSTPAVAAYYDRHPDRLLAARIQEAQARRPRPPQTGEQRERHNQVARRGQQARNEETRETATAFGARWSADEDAFILAHPELTNAALALALGRTAQGVHGRKTKLRQRGVRVP